MLSIVRFVENRKPNNIGKSETSKIGRCLRTKLRMKCGRIPADPTNLRPAATILTMCCLWEFLLLPSTAKCPVELHETLIFVASRRRQNKLRVEE
jgi:hypothetical protein